MAAGIASGTQAAIASDQNAANLKAVKQTNEANREMNDATNEMNYRIAQETNAANASQAQLAYERSMPQNQLRNLMAAGMSKPAALASLAGGGTYTAPTMVGSTAQASRDEAPHFDYSQFGEIAERIANLPSSVKQMQMVDAQIDNLKQEARLKENADRRAAAEEQRRIEIHDLDVWQRKYGKTITEELDYWTSRLASEGVDKNIDPATIKTEHDLVKAFNLKDDSRYMNLPAKSRQDLLHGYHQQADQLRQHQDSQDRHQAAQDSHYISVQTLNELKAKFNQWKSEQNARDKETRERELVASVNNVMHEMNLTKAELKRDFEIEYDKNGKPRVTPHKGIQGIAKEFWETIGAVIGVEYVGDILAKILTLK